MGVSEVTSEIASAIGQQNTPLTPREAYLLWVLRGMPLFREIRRLDLYETAYSQAAPDDGLSSTEKLIDAVYWLGANWFYGAYDAENTRQYYFEELMPLLVRHGIKSPADPDLSKW